MQLWAFSSTYTLQCAVCSVQLETIPSYLLSDTWGSLQSGRHLGQGVYCGLSQGVCNYVTKNIDTRESLNGTLYSCRSLAPSGNLALLGHIKLWPLMKTAVCKKIKTVRRFVCQQWFFLQEFLSTCACPKNPIIICITYLLLLFLLAYNYPVSYVLRDSFTGYIDSSQYPIRICRLS